MLQDWKIVAERARASPHIPRTTYRRPESEASTVSRRVDGGGDGVGLTEGKVSGMQCRILRQHDISASREQSLIAQRRRSGWDGGVLRIDAYDRRYPRGCSSDLMRHTAWNGALKNFNKQGQELFEDEGETSVGDDEYFKNLINVYFCTNTMYCHAAIKVGTRRGIHGDV
ncbi:hypothetical protein F5146DRAFT_1007445 [Armillaria mellea]|nr:hypothetical protein F5146DRAFT_1007442 [Armillaria mellea]KAK0183811.1 hypothetical protein F5146DRAFT_1007445 [Armillaria mellea]